MANYFLPGEPVDEKLIMAPVSCKKARCITTRFASSVTDENLIILGPEQLKIVTDRVTVLNDADVPAFVGCMFAKVTVNEGGVNREQLSVVLFPVIKTASNGQVNDYLILPDDRINGTYLQETWIDPTPNTSTPGQNQGAVDHFFPDDLKICPGTCDQ